MSCELVPAKEEPHDSNGDTVNKDGCRDQLLSSCELQSDKKRRLRSIVLSNDSRGRMKCGKYNRKKGKRCPQEQEICWSKSKKKAGRPRVQKSDVVAFFAKEKAIVHCEKGKSMLLTS